MKQSLSPEPVKIRLGCDLDDVIRDFISKLLEFTNPRFGKNLKREDIWTYDMWNNWNCSPEKSKEVIMEFYHSSYFTTIEPCDGAVSGINAIMPHYSTKIITACSASVEHISRSHLDNYFPKLELPLYHACSHFFPINGPDPQRTKAEICKYLSIPIMIEDNPLFARSCAEQGIETYVLRAPWNKGLQEQDKLKLVDGWDELAECLLSRVIHNLITAQPLKSTVNSPRDGFIDERV